MDVNMITDFISSNGFAIFVAVWMLIKDSKDKQAMQVTMSDLSTAIKVLTERVGGADRGNAS